MVTLADTSAWVEYLRRTGSATNDRFRSLLAAGDLAVCDPVRMEVLAGARDEEHAVALRRLLANPVDVPAESGDFELAAHLYRACRRQGETIRSLTDCLIAAIALRAGLPLVHADRDFQVLARHTPLQVDPGQ